MPVPALKHLLLAGALTLGAGCASAPPSAGHGQQGSAGQGGSQAATAPQPGAAQPAADPPGAAGGAATAGGSGGPAQTTDERRAAIDKRLDDSLGSFDAQLRTEQQRVAQERDARQAAAAAGSAATEGSAGGKGGDAGTTATEGPPSDADRPAVDPGRRGAPRPRDHSGDLKSEKASKKPDDNAGNGATAREIPDGSDDDVVARRLRQAAEQETDPELKAKLWKEYIDYKRNAQGK